MALAVVSSGRGDERCIRQATLAFYSKPNFRLLTLAQSQTLCLHSPTHAPTHPATHPCTHSPCCPRWCGRRGVEPPGPRRASPTAKAPARVRARVRVSLRVSVKVRVRVRMRARLKTKAVRVVSFTFASPNLRLWLGLQHQVHELPRQHRLLRGHAKVRQNSLG